MHGPVRRAHVWAATARAAVLFLLPLPLLVALLAALIAGDVRSVALTAGGLTCVWGAGVLAIRALAAEARYIVGERPDPPARPLKLLSAVLTAIGASLAAMAGGYSVSMALIFAGLGGIGHLAFYGRDLRPLRIHVAAVEGVDRAAVTLQLKLAHGRLRGIEAAARSIALPEYRDRLSRITRTGRIILGEIERDPSDAARARRFLNLYLDGAERVTREYARTHGQMRNQSTDENFGRLLAHMESTFAEQYRRLVERDLLSLDVDIEVLNERLKREGLG
jgi:5-bromo-4-chloroindolyl phosphate hydrolysis protein